MKEAYKILLKDRPMLIGKIYAVFITVQFNKNEYTRAGNQFGFI